MNDDIAISSILLIALVYSSELQSTSLPIIRDIIHVPIVKILLIAFIGYAVGVPFIIGVGIGLLLTLNFKDELVTRMLLNTKMAASAAASAADMVVPGPTQAPQAPVRDAFFIDPECASFRLADIYSALSGTSFARILSELPNESGFALSRLTLNRTPQEKLEIILQYYGFNYSTIDDNEAPAIASVLTRVGFNFNTTCKSKFDHRVSFSSSVRGISMN